MTKVWQLAHGRSLELGAKAVIMGILNVTPDSFSDGGQNDDVHKALAATEKMLGEGATIIDVGGESTRPGAQSIDADTEASRVIPVISALAARYDCIISVDTYRASTAQKALNAGAHIVNDVWGLQRQPATSPSIAEVAGETGAALVIMHTTREREIELDPIADRFEFLEKSLEIAGKAKVKPAQVVLDPGFGFGQDVAEDTVLMARMAELQGLGYPWLVGTSRKRFIGAVTGRTDALKRDIGTAATSVALRLAGADIFRVHNVAFNKDALAVADAILQEKSGL